ncbi:Mitochondrial ATP synthase g subunit [Microdochium nivale]|nr:Mitochondrial ATP synthase g subunit [Microdochium nivale]
MSSTVARPMLRQSGAFSRMAARRFESTTAKAAEGAKEAASKASSNASATAKDAATKAQAAAAEYTSKAREGLSKVTSSAGPAITGAATKVASSLTKVGGRTGKAVSLVEKAIPQVIYYSKVVAELGKIVFHGQKMAPPSISTFQTYFQSALKAVQNPSALLQTASKGAQQSASILQQARNINRGQVIAGGVIAAEVLGFFTVGEMIGRFKVVGYRGESGAAHH